MGSKLTYLLVFLMTFLGITGTLYILNDNFNNIFAFDFSPAPDLKQINKELKAQFDSLDTYYAKTKVDTYYVYNDTSLVRQNQEAMIENEKLRFDLSKKEEIINQQKETIAEQRIELKGLRTQTSAEQNEEFKEWVKATVKLFETMDSKKAARVIQNYSDGLAREIIYSMKKKKAAEILSELNPDLVTKLTGQENVL